MKLKETSEKLGLKLNIQKSKIMVSGPIRFSSVQSLSHIQLFVTPWTAARQASLSITNSQSSPKLNIHWVNDAIQPSHPLSSPSPPAFNLSQHPGLFKWVNSSHQVAKILEFQLQPQSLHWTPRTDLLAVQGTLESSPTPQVKSINSLALSFLHSPTLTSIHDHRKNRSLDKTDLSRQSNISAFEYAV